MSDPHKALQDATVRDRAGRVRGYNAISPNGDLVLARPDALRLAADTERGTYVDGLKDGWRLATAQDVAAKVKAENERRKAEGKPPIAGTEAAAESKAEGKPERPAR